MKKLVIRGDDIGYTHSFNIGAFQAIDEGIVTSADVMLESPGTEEALQMLKDRPWISIGWHAHLWESPVVGAENVPSMVDAEGRFKWRHSTDARQQKATVTYEDALKEFTAEMERCFAIVGRFPDTGALWSVESEYDQAMKDIMDRYGIAYNYMSGSVFGRNLIPDSKYAHLRYKNAPLINSKLEGLSRENMYDLANFKYCNVVRHMLQS